MINLPVNIKKKKKKAVFVTGTPRPCAKTNPDIESVQRCISGVTEFFLRVQMC